MHVDTDKPNGELYVASANFDRRFDTGAIIPLALDSVTELPQFGATLNGGAAVQIDDLPIASDHVVKIPSFTGEMEKVQTAGGYRLFTPSRSENSRLAIVDAAVDVLSCLNAQPGDSKVCTTDASAPSLTVNTYDHTKAGVPRAPEPFGVGVSPPAANCPGNAAGSDHLFVTHLAGADSPYTSTLSIRSYLVRVDPGKPVIDDSDFFNLGLGSTNSVAVGCRYAFASGRALAPFGHTVRLVDRTKAATDPEAVINPGLEQQFHVIEARGIALSSNEQRLYVIGRGPDTLEIVDVGGADTDTPSLTVVGNIPLPLGANEIKLIERPGRGTLAVITCSTAGVVAIYDDDAGALVAQMSVGDLTAEPFGIAIDERDLPGGGKGARIYVSNFGDGRVPVIDLDDVNRPQDAHLVAFLGKRQTCLITTKDASCQAVAK